MLVTQQAVLRRFWYPVMPMSMLADGRPKPFRLLNVNVVVWLDEDGAPIALEDRCCHRTAQLSRGFCERGRLICGYHGWEYDTTGLVIRMPQASPDKDHPTRMRTAAFHAAERYGYVWVSLDKPLHDLPEFEEHGAPGFRKIDQFYEVWNCAGLRLMENSFDNAHFSFTHRATFGEQGHPTPAEIKIENLTDGFLMLSSAPVANRGIQKKLLQIESDHTTRHMRARWYLPFLRKLQITYPNGLVHSIVTAATPIDDDNSQIVQFAFRNDTEDEAPAAEVIAFDRRVTEEDRYILESTDGDVPLDQSGREYNMLSDRPGLVMRRMIQDLLAAHGEVEVSRPSSMRYR